MQDITFNENYLITLKIKYDKAMKSNLEDKVFRLEEKLYDFIVKNYSEVLSRKLKLIDEFRNKDFKLWTIAFRNKQLKSSEIAKYKPDQQIYLKNFNREYLLGYYSLCFFAQNNFDRNTILNNKEPDKFAFTHFRSKYPDIDYPFNLIIEDLISYKTKDNKNKKTSLKDNSRKRLKYFEDSHVFKIGNKEIALEPEEVNFLYTICEEPSKIERPIIKKHRIYRTNINTKVKEQFNFNFDIIVKRKYIINDKYFIY